MSSARRPLWLRWANASEYAENFSTHFDLIFKNGDGFFPRKSKKNFISNIFVAFSDLRQDMLALQFIQMIDLIWKSDGLDLRFCQKRFETILFCNFFLFCQSFTVRLFGNGLLFGFYRSGEKCQNDNEHSETRWT